MVDEDWRNGGFGLYLHWPFCQAKCPYCDFNSFVRPEIDHARWTAAYLTEIDRYASLVPGRVLNSVFFGGGTPSLMKPETVAEILDRIGTHWSLANDLEVTLEANPTSVEAERFRDFAEAGINRISMGVQALNDADLHRLGRLHSAREATQAFEIAKELFDRVSFDLIYARQDQTIEEWRTELLEALTMTVDHLSLYQLTIEPGTVFSARHSRGRLPGLPTDDTAADMYDVTQELCETAGYASYEVSNYARPGAESRHNLIYWRYGDFIGIGPGAHGRITRDGQRYATETVKQPEKWLQDVDLGRSEGPSAVIEPDEQAQEYLMMSLRLSEGMSLSRYASLAGCQLDGEAISRLVDLGMVSMAGDRVTATAQGRVVLNAVIADLLTETENFSSPPVAMSGSDKDRQVDQSFHTK